jgi:hypothetical protein
VAGWGRPFDAVSPCRSLGADILVLQESWAPADGGPSTAAVVADRLGYRLVDEVGLARGRLYAPVATGTDRWGPRVSPLRTSFRLDGERWRVRAGADRPAVPGTWGVALLTRVPVEGSGVIPLGKLRRDTARRMALHCRVELEGGPLTLIGTHMSHITHGSHAQYRRLARALPPADEAAVLVGDMNLWGPPVSAYFRGWRRALTAKTWPAHRPHSQLDHILVTAPVEVVAARVGGPSGSDHLPVAATLARRPRGGAATAQDSVGPHERRAG